MLHIVNKSATERSSLESCLAYGHQRFCRVADRRRGLRGDEGNAAAAKIQAAMADLKIYALGPDLAARGMAGRVLDGVNVVDYGGFVDLVAEHSNCQSWL
jgi:tRNA 2-thiouridine synthesizing protein B